MPVELGEGLDMSKAYMAGFRKAAEDRGVDPNALIKTAFIGRYWQLLSGTGRATRGYRYLYDKLEELSRIKGLGDTKEGIAAYNKIKNLQNRLSVGAWNSNIGLGKNFLNELGEFGIAPEGKLWKYGLKRGKDGNIMFAPHVSGELDKSLATRVGTVGALGGLGYLSYMHA